MATVLQLNFLWRRDDCALETTIHERFLHEAEGSLIVPSAYYTAYVSLLENDRVLCGVETELRGHAFFRFPGKSIMH